MELLADVACLSENWISVRLTDTIISQVAHTDTSTSLGWYWLSWLCI